MASTTATDALSVIGFFLTLVGLLGSFFYIHLSDWLREVIALETKWRINAIGDEADQRAARRECRYEAEQVASWTTLLTSLVVTAFVLFIFVLAVNLWRTQPEKSDAWNYIGLAGIGFLAVYLGMTIYLLGRGYIKARRTLSTVRSYFNRKKRG
jgi:hypothetical protein